MNEASDLTRRKSAARAAREERLAKALRDNLRRRKEQARAQDRLAVPQSKARDRRHEPPA